MVVSVGSFRLTVIVSCLIVLATCQGASAQPPDSHFHPDARAVPHPPRRAATKVGGVSTTEDDQILVRLRPGDMGPAHRFDLNGRTVVFTPDGRGAYSRRVKGVTWESDIGDRVTDGAEIPFESFMFDFAGRRWGSFFVSRRGLITFGGPLTYDYWDAENRFDTMREIGGKFVTTPTISVLHKPLLGGRTARYGATQHVARSPDRIVVTWSTSEPDYYVHGVPPTKPSRLQVVLGADGAIALNYLDVRIGDGIVGLFPNEELTRRNLIASVADERNPELPGHLDLLEAALYETNTHQVILEFTMRDSIPARPREEYEYRLQYDTDRPWWIRDDRDFYWAIHVSPGGGYKAYGAGVLGLTKSAASNRIALLADIGDFEGIPAAVIADTIRLDDGSWIRQDASSWMEIQLPVLSAAATDLSQANRRFTRSQSEVFHYRSVPDIEGIVCRVIDVLGDEFDLFVFHSEFRVDSQESGTPWNGQRVDVRGIGVEHRNRSPPCGEGRLKGHWKQPVWMKSDHVVSHDRRRDRSFDRGLLLFAHEFTHAWTAHVSYLRGGSREPLFGRYCRCHWRTDLHQPAAFPWHEEDPGPRSLMGGRYWRDNRDGTFTPLDGYWGGGHSWLDLYAMGLAGADEVPEMFILRNRRPVRGGRHVRAAHRRQGVRVD